MRFLNTILDIVFPVKCILCGKTGVDLCLSCLRETPAALRESAEWIFPLYDYRHPGIKKSLWLLKYKGKKRLANVFAEIIYEKILEELSELSIMENFTEPVLIPIPLSPKRRRERGFNQAELICRELVKINNLRYSVDLNQEKKFNLKLESGVLIKPKETEHQARIKDRRQRLKNIIGSFAVKNGELIKNRNIILIDDILTTGATLSEAKKVLKQAGARKIIAFTIAH
ncbi:MAG: Phosphoribosyltransferase [Candidatus Nomurabacteria bacterium GW2011_GWA2_43_15]|uniref:Phosphoribosyltransferase n=2 Tax=Candidatus Nomuraibacteriota TaxID=1752729 RepID=A0A0G1DTI6_9BACT|nr:MAG: Phosphoribosyltransferase [Candidatus Nomurabacteria bacterium GW2011_GWA2_43_15]KKT19849.1 MAG: Phosphoribosyltransferase [Candidatus Nomurabacteria bacterium GW2011_GWB1_43_7]